MVCADVRDHVFNYLWERLRKNPGMHWNSNRFSAEILPEGFREVANLLGLKPGMRVLHTHTTGGHYAQLLREHGLHVDTLDVLASSAVRSGGKVLDATRLYEWPQLKDRYHLVFQFEPAQYFLSSGNGIGAAGLTASSIHAVKKPDGRIVIAARAPAGVSAADNMEATLEWMRRYFGLRYDILRHPETGDRTFYLPARYDALVVKETPKGYRSARDRVEGKHPFEFYVVYPDPEVQRRLQQFHHDVDSALLKEIVRRGWMNDFRNGLNAMSDPVLSRRLDELTDVLHQVPASTVKGEMSAHHVLRGYIEIGRTLLRSM